LARFVSTASPLAAALLLLAAAGGAAAAFVKVGVLTCEVSASTGYLISQTKQLACTYAPTGGRPESYTGRLRKVGLTDGRVGAGVIVWDVLSEGGAPPGGVGGAYFNAGRDDAAVTQAIGKVLLGGFNRWFALLPVAASGAVDMAYARDVTGLELFAAP
jgi:hypothetical protein